MSFTGTLDKCKACDKTVYVVDLLSLEGVPYHKSCFKCSHCKGTLQMSNYSSMDGVLFCKTHFEQLFKESGNFSKNFQSVPKLFTHLRRFVYLSYYSIDSLSLNPYTYIPLMSPYLCPLKVTMEAECYHKTCFRCAIGGCHLTHSSYAALDGVLYCKHHFAQLFLEKGNYNHILQAASHKRSASTPPPEAVEGEAEEATAGDGTTNQEGEDNNGK
ncbi:unnamed protein product [Linum tenue]|uniref:LIM zinc-binding domain-containing protein n=1 Tax=Linum tenue TaxID=586396 RepID=A0AAV0KTS1_9ROSI|nr:unnamed protein product [Linum tenue]